MISGFTYAKMNQKYYASGGEKEQQRLVTHRAHTKKIIF